MTPVSMQLHAGIAVISIDHPPVNALSLAVRQGLVACLRDAADHDDAEAIVVICAGRTFIAGADIREFDLPPSPPHLPDVVAAIEACDKPVVAAIHGTALGGGLEVAMGCHYRIATTSAALGLPEVKLGLLPGASGTQRLPRLIGAARALDLMLSGESISAVVARDFGLVDQVCEDDRLLPAAIAFARERVPGGPRRVRDLSVPPVEAGLFEKTRQRIAKKTRGLLSPERIVRCVELAVLDDFDEGCRAERAFFLECRESSQSRALRHAFFAERAAARGPALEPDAGRRDIRAVAVVGAGTMGVGIAYTCLVAGYTVHLLDSDESALARGAEAVRDLFKAGVERGKLSSAGMRDGLQRFVKGDDYAGIRDVDLVIEAVVENLEVKRSVFARLDEACKPGAILATNTSTLDVDEIAAATSRPADVVGLHFFSPAHVMRLLEIVRGARIGDDVLATAVGLARTLGKIGVVVGNCFGFVGNRMLYGYGRENQLMLLEGVAPERIDRVLVDWGMAMGPNAVGDLAGLDVGYRVRRERSDLPDDPRFYRVADMLVEQRRLGQKAGRGIYRYEQGSRKPVVDPEVTAMIRQEAARLGVEQREISDREIVDRCIYGLVTEGARILQEKIAGRSADIDVVWINGYGFPRYRGGPMFHADTVGLAAVLGRVLEFRTQFGPLYWEPPELLVELASAGRRFSDV